MTHISIPLPDGCRWPDYDNSIVNLTCTILDYFKAPVRHPVLPELSRLLKEGHYKNVIVFVCDGMGTYNMELALPKDSFLRSHLAGTLTSVFPPTTVAATTSIETGLTPKEHGWPGWSAYFKELDTNVNLFINTTDTGEPAADYSVTDRYLKYRSAYEQIRDAGYASANSVSRFGTLYADSLEEIYETVLEECQKPEPQYLYCYCPEPDHTMHEQGVTSPAAIKWIRRLNRDLEMLSKKLADTLLIVTADHGHIDGKNLALSDIPGLSDTLHTAPSIEPRTLSCFLKEGCHETFKQIYQKYLQDDFLLLTHNEVLEHQIFGTGEEHPKFADFIGDYLLIATGERCLFQTTEERDFFIGVHAGLLEKEMNVPLMIIDAK